MLYVPVHGNGPKGHGGEDEGWVRAAHHGCVVPSCLSVSHAVIHAANRQYMYRQLYMYDEYSCTDKQVFGRTGIRSYMYMYMLHMHGS